MPDPEVVSAVRRELPQRPTPADLAAALRPHVSGGSADLLATYAGLRRQVIGAGPLDPLLAIPDVSDVLVNGAGVVWVDRGAGIEDSGVRIATEGEVRALAHRLVASCGRRLDDARPYADARLPDGTRVHAVLPPIAPQGTTLSLRVPPRRVFTLDGLVECGALPADGARLLADLVTARVSFVVTGGTGTGKTTVLATLLSRVPATERIVLVEDAGELRPEHPHVVRLEGREPNAEGSGAVGLDVLVRQALRMRPDRLVVGEVRGPEVVDLLAALNTGHDGGCATVHASRADLVPARFEALCAAAGMPREAAHVQLLAGVQAVVHLRRAPGGRRAVAGVAVLVRAAGGAAVSAAAYGFDGSVRRGPAAAVLDRLLA
jgi:pilus assembly protein CpaF